MCVACQSVNPACLCPLNPPMEVFDKWLECGLSHLFCSHSQAIDFFTISGSRSGKYSSMTYRP